MSAAVRSLRSRVVGSAARRSADVHVFARSSSRPRVLAFTRAGQVEHFIRTYSEQGGAMSTSTMSVVAWVESPLQLVGAAEWARAHGAGCRSPAGSPRRCRRPPTSSSPAARVFGPCEPYLGIPWKLLVAAPPLARGRRILGAVPPRRRDPPPAPDHVPRRRRQCGRVRRHADRAAAVRAARVCTSAD